MKKNRKIKKSKDIFPLKVLRRNYWGARVFREVFPEQDALGRTAIFFADRHNAILQSEAGQAINLLFRFKFL